MHGPYHSIVIAEDGSTLSFGSNDHGQLGLGHTHNFTTFQTCEIPQDKVITQASCGYAHTMILVTDGLVLSCGQNSDGQLGLGQRNDQSNFQLIAIPGDTKAKLVTCGYLHSVVLAKGGSILTCGSNTASELGRVGNRNTFIEVQLPAGKHATYIGCGRDHNVAIMNDGSVYNWSNNDRGQLGQANTNEQALLTPVPLPPVHRCANVA